MVTDRQYNKEINKITEMVRKEGVLDETSQVFTNEFLLMITIGEKIIFQEMRIAVLERAIKEFHAEELDTPSNYNDSIQHKKEEVQILKEVFAKYAKENVQSFTKTDMLEFANQSKLNTQQFDEYEDKSDLVYNHLQSKNKSQNESTDRIVKAYTARKVIDLLSKDVKESMAVMLVDEAGNGPTDNSIIAKNFIRNIGVSMDFANKYIYKELSDEYRPFFNYLSEHNTYFNKEVDYQMEWLIDEASTYTMTSVRAAKFAEQVMRIFSIGFHIEDEKSREEFQMKEGLKLQQIFLSLPKSTSGFNEETPPWL